MIAKYLILILIATLGVSGYAAQNQYKLEEMIETDITFLWHETTSEDYFRLIGNNIDAVVGEEDFLPLEDPRHQQLHSDLIRIDSNLRNLFDHRLSNIPVPNLRVLSRPPYEKRFNAFVIRQPLCYDVPLIWDVDAARRTGLATLDLDSGEAPDPQLRKLIPIAYQPDARGAFGGLALECSNGNIQSITPQKLAEMIHWMESNDRSRVQSGCSLSVMENLGEIPLAIVANQNCKVDPDLRSLSAGTRYFRFAPNSNTITVYLGMLSLLKTREQLQSLLAHELVHYYLAHGVSSDEDTGYFYDLEQDRVRGVLPERNEQWDKLGKMMVALSDEYAKTANFVQVAGARWRSEIYSMATDVVLNLCAGGEQACPSSCQPIQPSHLPGALNGSNVGRGLLPQDISDYDTNLQNCFQQVRLNDTSQDARENGSSIEKQYFIRNLQLDYPFQDICIGGFSHNHSDLYSFFDDVNMKLDRYNCVPDVIREQAAEISLGYYTTEQEADELALDLMEMSGVPLRAAYTELLVYAELSGDPGCAMWSTKQSQQSTVRIDDFSVHHDICFRWHRVKQIVD